MNIFLSVGEPSGDLHGANLIRDLKERMPECSFSGFGGPKMKSTGQQQIASLVDDRLVGVTNRLGERTQELDTVIEVLEIAFFPDLYGFFVLAVGPYANTFRVVALLAEWRGTTGTDPLVAALVTLLLLFQALLELLDELFQATQ